MDDWYIVFTLIQIQLITRFNKIINFYKNYTNITKTKVYKQFNKAILQI